MTPSQTPPPLSIVVLAGGVGGAKYLLGVRRWAQQSGATVTAIVNTGDDATMHGLRVCPDLDSVMYTLAGTHDPDRGWGQVDESWVVGGELAEYGTGPTWFSLGDKDIATHLVRTQMLDAGYPLSDVTKALSTRWDLGVDLLPMSDQRVETHAVADVPGDNDGGPQRKALHFQEWWVRYRAALPTHAFVQVGLEQASPAPGVTEAIANADLVLLAPSNPVVSIGTILGLPAIRDAVRATKAPVIGTSPLIGGSPLRGMADTCLKILDVEPTALGVAAHYGSRAADGVLDGWLVAPGDGGQVDGLDIREVPLLMTDPDATAAMVDAAAELAGVARG